MNIPYTKIGIPRPPSAHEAVVGSAGEYSTVQAAYDDGAKSILVGHDYDPKDENYPIEIKADDSGNWTPVRIEGVGPNSTVIGDPSQKADTIQVHGNKNHYGEPIYIENLNLTSHRDKTCLKVAALSSGKMKNVVAKGAGNVVKIRAPYIDGYVGGCFDWVFRDVDIWNCRSGIRIKAGAAGHNVLMDKVDVTACKKAGVYAQDCGTVTYRGGTNQLNHGYGFELRDVVKFTISDAYVEGNARAKSYPVEIYGLRAHSLTIRDSYFHGINPRGASGHDYNWVQRAVNLHKSENVAIRDCEALRYGDRFHVNFGGDTITDNIRIRDDTPLN